MGSEAESNAIWADALRRAFGPIPPNYFLFDTETTGVNVNEDYPLQVAQAVVQDRKLVCVEEAHLNWFAGDEARARWIRNKMQDTALRMAERGATYRVTPEAVSRGADPLVVLENWAKTVQASVSAGCAIVGHNIVNFDLVMMSIRVRDLLGIRLLVPDELVIDTGMLEKARQLCLVPEPNESRISWFRRVSGRRARVKWRLDGHCAEQYDLWTRSKLDPTDAHDAKADCVLTHHLLESIRDTYDL